MRSIFTSEQVGAILSSRRKHVGMSQAKVAESVGLSQNRLSVLESNPETLTVKQLLALLNVLGLEMSLNERAAGKSKVEW